jgi:hypothetical protein
MACTAGAPMSTVTTNIATNDLISFTILFCQLDCQQLLSRDDLSRRRIQLATWRIA